MTDRFDTVRNAELARIKERGTPGSIEEAIERGWPADPARGIVWLLTDFAIDMFRRKKWRVGWAETDQDVFAIATPGEQEKDAGRSPD